MANTLEQVMSRRVVCAAIRNSSGQIICSARHFDALMHLQINEQIHGGWKFAEQGFIDQHGAFLSREEAWLVAEAAGQIIRRVGGDGVRLFSENLY